jgi:hypothetical protein
MDTVKATHMSRPINAPEWAVRWAMALADVHMPEETFEKRAAFVADMAEVIVTASQSPVNT